jgi:hypothetical protein
MRCQVNSWSLAPMSPEFLSQCDAGTQYAGDGAIPCPPTSATAWAGSYQARRRPCVG